MRGLLEELVLVRECRGIEALQRGRRRRRRHRAASEINLARGKLFEGRFGHAEVLRQKRLGSVAQPVRDAERAEFREVAVVEDQDEVARLIPETFEHMSVAAGKKPDVPRLE